MRANVRLGILVCVSLLVAACGGSLRVAQVASAHKKPSNVWVLLTVEQGEQPVVNLTADDFAVYEDGRLVPRSDSQQVIQDAESVSVRQTLLLVDVSGSAALAGRAALVDAVSAMSERLGKTQRVGVYAFDGSARIHSVVPLGDEPPAIAGGLDGLRELKPEDPSTNLHGAVVEGLRQLKRSLDSDARPLKFGTLVVFSSGADRAARVTADAMEKEIESADYRSYELYAIGVGGEAKSARLSDVGRDGSEVVASASDAAPGESTLRSAARRLAARIEGRRKRFYLLSYCTPARGGEHELRIEARTKGDPPSAGSLWGKFVADGFGTPPACDPAAPPAFEAKAPLAPPPPPEPAPHPSTDKPGDKPKERARPSLPSADAAHRKPNDSKLIDWKPPSE